MASGYHLSCVHRWAFGLAALGAVSFGWGQAAYLPVKTSLPAGLAKARPLRRMAAETTLHLSISLPYRDPAGIQRFVDSVSDPHSSNYRQFIDPAEVGRRFGPSVATIEKVKAYLTQHGMNVRLSAGNGLSLLADATVGQAEEAFRTEIDEFAPATGQSPSGKKMFSFVTRPALPADLRPYVTDIGGLENFTHPEPLSSYLTPNQVQTLYGVSPMYSAGTQGQGRTIAISSWDGYRLSNVPFEYSEFGLPAPSGGVGSNIKVETVDGGSGAGTEQGEGDLDIQSILGVAPLCNLIIYDGSGGDLISVLTLEANDNKADIISESYGWTLDSSTASAAHNLHLSMSAQGITYMAASGDSGTNLSYYYPNIEPEVLMVGGTTCNTDSSGNRISEVGWSGSGGGWKATTDSFNVLPSYQKGTGVPTNVPYRLIPDVALNADPNSGYVVYLDGGYYIIGGTSGASPTFAGSLGDSEQQLITNGSLAANGAGKYRLGRIQDVIYALNGDSSVFFDVTQGSNGNLPSGSASSAGVGWDFVTGWGAMNFNGFVGKLSATGLTQLSVSPATLEGGTATVTGTVTTATTAPAGGTAISISGGDGKISYPASVTIPAGSRSATFSIATTSVSATDTETLSASDGTNTKTATLTLNPTAISAFTFSPTSGAAGSSFTGTITLVHAAVSPGGDSVALSGGDSNVSFPATITVPAGKTSATFTMSSTLSAANDTEKISATLGASVKTATVSLTGVAISTFTFAPATVIGGTSVTGTITLTVGAPTGGLTLPLTGGDSAVTFPSSVTIAANAKTVSFTVTTKPVGSPDVESITATVGSSSKVATFTVNPPAISSLVFSPNSVFGGVSSQGTVTLSGPAPSGGLTVSLSGGDASVSYPASVSIASGGKTATFAVATSVVSTTDTETIKAVLGSSTVSGTLTLKPEGILASLSFSPTSVVGGKTTVGTVRLTAGAGPLGVVVSLTGGDSSISYPATVSIASGASTATFTVTTSMVTANATENLVATLGLSTAKGAFTLLATAVSSLAFSPNSVFGGVSSTGTVTLNGPAPSGGLTVALSGGDSSIGYPSSVTVASGATTATFAASTSIVPTADTETVKAALFSSTVSGTLTIKPAGVLSSLTFSPTSIVGGKTTTGTIRLTTGAGPQGVVVTLSGGDSSISYPTTVSIASGVSSATFTVTSSMVSTTVTETLTAGLGPSTAKGSFTLQAMAVSSLAFSPNSVFGGVSSTGTVTLNGPAPAGGLSVALSGGDSSIGYPANVTVASGATTATFTATTLVVPTTDTETVKAALFSSTAAGTLTVKPAGVLSSLSFSPASVIGGTNSTGTIRLTGPAGPLGVVVSLTGGDLSIAYPASVSIAAGASSATFTVTTAAVAANVTESLTATLGPSVVHGSLAVTAATLSTFTVSPTSVSGGASSTGTLTLTGPAGPGGVVIAISGGDTSIGYPATVSIAAGAKSATFTITTSSVTATKTEAVSAKMGSTTKSASLKLTT